jgi:hypothetical protein
MNEKRVEPMREVLEEIADPRSRLGKRYPLVAILMLVCAAMLCGHDNLNQIAIWGQTQGAEFLKALGFARGRAPKKSTLYEVLGALDAGELEQILREWAESVLRELGGEGALQGVAIDGKVLRGSKKQGATIGHLLSAVSHGLGITLYQVGVDKKSHEIPAAEELLKGLLLEGRVFTMDALLTQRKLAQTIIDGGGDYFMAVKGNQKTLAQDIALEFQDFSP